MTHFEYESPSPYNPGCLRVQNRRARTLLEFAIDTARSYGGEAGDADEVRRLEAWYGGQFFDGMIVEIAELFPDLASRRFWCRAFLDAARRVFRRELGNRDLDFWQASCICDAVTIARMLLQAARDIEPGWEGPVPLDWAEEAAWNERQADGDR